ncbi:DUF1353 domain-containing protein [Corallococcus sp. CA054B]|uniref:DUF1353 domain-containing protein n=1 Tax=Corallococcus sp. CA054B TaxID=2316734 RepID=UPI000EA2734D|nr:DUF1353 domain-containing protein [Corallococcus sp. CA054B]RKG70010.1 DUF1353 domain-containing protein [Corallococcus sp. CA054B]
MAHRKSNETIIVPEGFVHDYASIPRGFWSIGLSPHDRYSRAAIIHDYLYWTQGCTREQADALLMIAMQEEGVSPVKRWAVYGGVVVGGSKAWKNNKSERTSGLTRYVPTEYRDLQSFESWANLRVKLKAAGIIETPEQGTPSYCKLGDSIDVPSAYE